VYTTPGEVLGSLADYAPGPGTYAWGGNVLSSVVGLQHIVPSPPDAPDQVLVANGVRIPVTYARINIFRVLGLSILGFKDYQGLRMQQGEGRCIGI
jgi:hypothetical protein